MNKTDELMRLAQEVDKILKEELKKNNIKYDFAEARIYNAKSVGVQGDERTYSYPAEICLYDGGKFVWKTKFLRNLSSRITNEIRGINRVTYVTAFK